LPDEITFEKLKKAHLSCPRNELLADVFFKAGYIEAWGRGTIRIIEACRKAGLPDPEFSELTGGFLVAFTKAPTDEVEKGSEKGKKKRLVEGLAERLVEGLAESQRKMLDLIKRNPRVSKKELSAKIGISTTAIDKNIAQLKKKGILRRVGPDKGGHWEVGNHNQ